MSTQLPLALTHVSTQTFGNLAEGDNGLCIMAVKSLLGVQSNAVQPKGTTAHAINHAINNIKQVVLTGPSGAGKSHVVSAMQDLAKQQARSCYAFDIGSLHTFLSNIPSDEQSDLLNELFNAVESYSLVCLDNIDALLNSAISKLWQRILFDIINRINEQQHALLLTSSIPVKDPLFTLPDLGSRLSWGQVYALQPLNDVHMCEALRSAVAQRGIKCQANALEYLLKVAPRDMHQLQRIIEELDTLALAQKKGITIPLIKQLFAEVS